MFITFCVNLWVLFINSFYVLKHFAVHLPVVRILVIGLVIYFVYKMSNYEYQRIKDPYMKAGRRRL